MLWHGRGIYQLSYVGKEFKLSDHQPVCATLIVEVDDHVPMRSPYFFLFYVESCIILLFTPLYIRFYYYYSYLV